MAKSDAGTKARVHTTPSPPARRPRWHALRDIVFIAFIWCYFFIFAINLPFSRTGYEEIGLVSESVAVATDLGAAALGAAGWGFGVLITALLGFFAITVGGNYLYRDYVELSFQFRSLASVAVIAAGTTLFCAILIITFCLSRASEVGQLFFVIPSVIVIVFVAIEVGVYLAPEPERVISNALKTRAWARAKAMKLEPKPPHGLASTLITNSMAIAFVAMAIVRPDNSWASVGPVYSMLVVGAGLVAFSCASAKTVSHTSQDCFSPILSWVMITLFYGLLAVAAVALAAGGADRLSAALFFIAGACLLSTFFPRRGAWRGLYEWSLAGGAAADSIQTLRKTDRRGVDDIAKAKSDIRHRPERGTRDASA